jgi:hypothetical protein
MLMWMRLCGWLAVLAPDRLRGARSAAVNVGQPHVEEMKNGHPVLSYEMSSSVEGLELRTVTAWTAVTVSE